MRLRRLYENLRCLVGLHRLRGYRAPGESIHVMPIDPRARPGPGDWRKCDWCGATWVGAYDGINPGWMRR